MASSLDTLLHYMVIIMEWTGEKFEYMNWKTIVGDVMKTEVENCDRLSNKQ